LLRLNPALGVKGKVPEAGKGQRVNACLRAAGDHYISVTVLNEARGVAQRVGARSTGRDACVVGSWRKNERKRRAQREFRMGAAERQVVLTSEAMSKADPTGGHVDQDLGDEVRRHLPIALMIEWNLWVKAGAHLG
jgi:hypothetical protein